MRSVLAASAAVALASAAACQRGAVDFKGGGIGPEPIPFTVERGGQTLRGLALEPNRVYWRLRFPDFPLLVGALGELAPTRRVRHYSCWVNGDGLRGWRRYPPRRPEGTFRIGVLGTGVTFGEGVSMGQTYPRHLEEALNGDPPLPRDFEVVNFGTPCLTTDAALGNFVRYDDRWEVDFWIVALGVNDALPMFHRSPEDFRLDIRALVAEITTRGRPALVLVEPVNSFYPWRQRYPDYLAALQEEVRPALPLLDVSAMLDCLERQEGLRLEVDGDRQSMVRYRRGQPTVLVQAEHTIGRDRPAIAPEVYDYFEAHDTALRTFITDVHLNPLGHERVAEALFAWLAAWVTGRQAPALDPATCALR